MTTETLPFRPARQGAAALGLRLAGASYEEIADALGMANAREAQNAVEVTLGNRALQNAEDRDRARGEAAARLERLLRGVWPKAIDGDHPEHLPAVKVAQSLIDRHIRLYGLDAPAEVVVHNPTTAEIDAWVGAMLSRADGDFRAMEARIIDVDDVLEPISGPASPD